MTSPHRTLAQVSETIVTCAACPRLVAWRERVAREKVARFRRASYWGKPVPGFGDADAWLLVVGLAPGAHGANRTGRMFTGDSSGDFLYPALHRAGLASQAHSTSVDDGLVLRGAFISAALRCAPPGNAPLPAELRACASFLDDEIALLKDIKVVLALGAISWRACLGHLGRAGVDVPRPAPPFAHGARFDAPTAPANQAEPTDKTRVLLGSYHVSQQNTRTGRLTADMFDKVLRDAVTLGLRKSALSDTHVPTDPHMGKPSGPSR